MRFESIDTLVRALGFRIPAINEVSLREFIIEACRSFCYRTQVSQADITSIVGQGLGDISLSTPGGTEVISVITAATELGPIEPATVAFMDATRRNWRASVGTPNRFVMLDERTILVAPIPATVMDVTLRVACRPLRDATRVDVRLTGEWEEAIRAKVLSEYHPDPNERLLQQGKYEFQVSKCLAAVRAGTHGAEQRVVMRPFGK